MTQTTLSRRHLGLGLVGAAGLATQARAATGMDCQNYERLGLHEPFRGGTLNGRSNSEILGSLNVPEDAQYNPCAEAHPPAEAPRGNTLKIEGWAESRIYSGTTRDIWVHTPPGLDTATADLPVIVFQDGGGYLASDGPVRAPAVLDTLAHLGDIPPTVGVFVNPGARSGGDQRDDGQRSVEYDSVTPTYSEFLLQELLPLVEARIGRKLSRDPKVRTVCGISSGGICAFNTAWHAPDAFGRVISHCGSFTNIKGGHNYPYLVRATERKDIKVFLTSGKRDANIIIGSWPLANQQMAASLEYAGYEVRFEFGEGGHSARHGGALFADSLRWLWS